MRSSSLYGYKNLKNKTALITGGAGGIGLHIALALAEEGVNIAIADRHFDKPKLEAIRSHNVQVLPIETDISEEGNVIEMVKNTIGAFGQLDFFVNNAAIARHQPLTKITTAAWRAALDTNLSACIWGCREAAKHMILRQTGSILIVGSTSMYTPGPGETTYRITKMGLKSLNESLAIELAPHRIRVNLLVPGHYRTNLTTGIPAEIEERIIHEIPLRRFGNLNECGQAAVVLLSDAISGYTTGTELIVDGGLHLRPMNFLPEEILIGLNHGS